MKRQRTPKHGTQNFQPSYWNDPSPLTAALRNVKGELRRKVTDQWIADKTREAAARKKPATQWGPTGEKSGSPPGASKPSKPDP